MRGSLVVRPMQVWDTADLCLPAALQCPVSARTTPIDLTSPFWRGHWAAAAVASSPPSAATHSILLLVVHLFSRDLPLAAAVARSAAFIHGTARLHRLELHTKHAATGSLHPPLVVHLLPRLCLHLLGRGDAAPHRLPARTLRRPRSSRGVFRCGLHPRRDNKATHHIRESRRHLPLGRILGVPIPQRPVHGRRPRRVAIRADRVRHLLVGRSRGPTMAPSIRG